VSKKRRKPGSGSTRILRREPDGDLFDLKQRRVVPISELREDVRAGRRFCAEDRDGGEDCTYAVLGRVVWGGTAGPQDGRPPDSLSSLVHGTVRNVLDWAADEVDDTDGSPGQSVRSPARRRRPKARGASPGIRPS
jgi:hypothetical protein